MPGCKYRKTTLSVYSQKARLRDSAPDLPDLGSQLSLRVFRWICSIVGISVCSIRLPIADTFLWFGLLGYQYISLLDTAPVNWCDSLVGCPSLSAHQIARFGSRLLIGFCGWTCLDANTEKQHFQYILKRRVEPERLQRLQLIGS